MKRARRQQGSVVFDKRSRTWHFLWCDSGHRRSRVIGRRADLPTKAAAWKVAETIRAEIQVSTVEVSLPTVREVAERYERERLPTRANTARVYRAWLHNHVLPYWGERPISDIQPRETELWLEQLSLAPKSKSHVKDTLTTVVNCAMWSRIIRVASNPVSLVRIKGATTRVRQPRSLKVDEFWKLEHHLAEPYRTMAVAAVCLGLRVSELLALRWSDVDWPSMAPCWRF